MLSKIIKGLLRRLKNSIYFFISWNKIDNESLRKIIRMYERFNLIPSLHSKKQEIIISLTTYGERFNEVHYTLFSLFRQNVKPDKIVLWLDEKEFDNNIINQNVFLKKYMKKGLEIRFCENFKSYKKIIPSLKAFSESTIILCDDDAYYNKNWLALLLEEHKKYPKDILCHIGTQIKIQDRQLFPYNQWESKRNSMAGYNLVPIGIGGTLVRKELFYKDICNDTIFMELLPTADDLWIWAQSVLNNTSIRIINNSCYYPKDFGTDRDYPKLWILNNNGGNDLSIKNLLSYYPQLKTILKINN